LLTRTVVVGPKLDVHALLEKGGGLPRSKYDDS